jgi:hypothetical protein
MRLLRKIRVQARTRHGDDGDGVGVPGEVIKRRCAAPATAQHRIAVPSGHSTLHEVQGEDEVH